MSSVPSECRKRKRLWVKSSVWLNAAEASFAGDPSLIVFQAAGEFMAHLQNSLHGLVRLL
jgi:hypothetical protein